MPLIPICVLALTGCSGPWPQLPNNPNYDPADWRVAQPEPEPEPAPAPTVQPFAPDTQDIGTSSNRARLPSNPKGTTGE